jgi:DeoR/GlpR family transcriptional regulator of sugar metabolism
MLDDFKGDLTTSNYAKHAKCSNDTALRDIRELLARGIVAKNSGGGRSTSYRLAEPDEVSVSWNSRSSTLIGMAPNSSIRLQPQICPPKLKMPPT